MYKPFPNVSDIMVIPIPKHTTQIYMIISKNSSIKKIHYESIFEPPTPIMIKASIFFLKN
jgi:hypothetical protein